MLPAEPAVLLGFHSVRMGLLILGHVVIALFALGTCQCDSCAHDFHLHLSISLLCGLFLYQIIPSCAVAIRQGVYIQFIAVKMTFRISNPFISEQNVAASADTRVRQHGFCELMNGLDTLQSIQPHSRNNFEHKKKTSVLPFAR